MIFFFCEAPTFVCLFFSRRRVENTYHTLLRAKQISVTQSQFISSIILYQGGCVQLFKSLWKFFSKLLPDSYSWKTPFLHLTQPSFSFMWNWYHIYTDCSFFFQLNYYFLWTDCQRTGNPGWLIKDSNNQPQRLWRHLPPGRLTSPSLNHVVVFQKQGRGIPVSSTDCLLRIWYRTVAVTPLEVDRTAWEQNRGAVWSSGKTMGCGVQWAWFHHLFRI